MGRPKRQNLDYFPMDVTYIEDYKIRRLLRKHGVGGIGLYFALLREVYGKNGYYLKWSEEALLSVAELNRCEEEMVDDVLCTCLELNLFSAKVYAEKGILTSSGIQRRYLMACKERIRNLKSNGRTMELERSVWLLSEEETQTLLLDMKINGDATACAAETGVSTVEMHEEARFLPEKVHKAKESKEKAEESTQDQSRGRAEYALPWEDAPSTEAEAPAAGPAQGTQWRFKLSERERRALEAEYGREEVEAKVLRLQDWAGSRGYWIKNPADKIRSWIAEDERKEKKRIEAEQRAAQQPARFRKTSAHAYEQRQYGEDELDALLFTDIEHLND